MLTGKGMYIWKIKNAAGGDGEAASIAALNAGFTHVMIKVLDGPWAYNQRPVYDEWGDLIGYEDDILKPFMQPFQDKGIQVWGWQYVYHLHPVQEAEAANYRVDNLNLDGFIIDAEREVKHKNKAAAQYMNRLDVGVPLALSSYRYPVLHQELPWGTYLGGCDLVMPQVYWEGSVNSGSQLAWSYNEYREFLKTDLPFVPTGAAYARGSWHATPDQVERFMDMASSLELPAVNFYRWQTARQLPGEWETIARYDYGAQPPPPPPSTKSITARLELEQGVYAGELYLEG